MTVKETKQPSEKEVLETEKIQLAKKLGIWGEFKPIENYDQTEEFKRIAEIDQQLFRIVKQ